MVVKQDQVERAIGRGEPAGHLGWPMKVYVACSFFFLVGLAAMTGQAFCGDVVRPLAGCLDHGAVARRWLA